MGSLGRRVLRRNIPGVELRFQRTIPLAQGMALRADAIGTQCCWQLFKEGIVARGVGDLREYTEAEATAVPWLACWTTCLDCWGTSGRVVFWGLSAWFPNWFTILDGQRLGKAGFQGVCPINALVQWTH